MILHAAYKMSLPAPHRLNEPWPCPDRRMIFDQAASRTLQHSLWCETERAMSDQVSAIAAPATAAAKSSGVRWNIFFLMLFLISINYIDRASLLVAMPLISKEFDVDPAMQGLILSSFFWTYAFMQVPGGMLADRYKPRIVIALATIFWGAFQAIAAGATNWAVLLLHRLGFWGAGVGLYSAR